MKNDIVPLVSIIMPIRNEAEFIERSLRAVTTQNYPREKMEVIVVDGLSSDGTREIISKIKMQNAEIKILFLDNPKHIVPTALNIGLKHAQGEVIIRIDGHCEITADYVKQCIEAFKNTGADCVGGSLRTISPTFVGKSIAIAQSSFFGVGNAIFRIGVQKGTYVDTIAFGAYRREVFERIGNFDEELIRNQDDEFNFRLIQAGGKIWLDPLIRSAYYCRSTLKSLWRQYFQYGIWKVRVIQKRKAVLSWRHLVPSFFVFGITLGCALTLFTGKFIFALAMPILYAIAAVCASIVASGKKWGMAFSLPFIFFILHVSYGLGFIAGCWKWRKSWVSTHSLS